MMRQYCITCLMLASLYGGALASPPVEAEISLYGVFEARVTNSNQYNNPFDYTEIELRSTFTSPSGKKYRFFGFHDGNGRGGQDGNVWKIRFMPDEIGQWSYTYSWTDGTEGGNGTFFVVDTGLPGPLRIASDNPKFFMNARGSPLDLRGYSLHQYVSGKYAAELGAGYMLTREIIADYNDKIVTKVAARGYNLLMSYTAGIMAVPGNANSYWVHSGSSFDLNRFNVEVWKWVESSIETAKEEQVYVLPFAGIVHQAPAAFPNHHQLKMLLRYMAARLGPYWNYFGYSATWEYWEIWSELKLNTVMSTLERYLRGLPLPPLLTTHDRSANESVSWRDFSMRQLPSRDVFTGNCRLCGLHGGVRPLFVDRPILGSEDIWEYHEPGPYGQPRSGGEVRSAAWGILMAGVIPIYSEVGLTDEYAPRGGQSNFTGEGERYVRQMFDFYYAETAYRRHERLNDLVSRSAGQIASGIAGTEYLVYDQDGGEITVDLNDVSRSSLFTVTWYDPVEGVQHSDDSVTGGAARTFSPPFAGDAVLLLRSSAEERSDSPP